MAIGTQGTDLQQRFDHLVSSYPLWKSGDKLLLAFSGGLDSVVLFHLLYRHHANFELAHINFGLRGAESDEDERWCRNKAFANAAIQQKMLSKINIHTIKFNTKELAEKGESIQMIARRLRYEWLQQLKAERNCQYILTAHHLNDQLETVLYNLTKGTGTAGLQGMPLKRDKLVRPMLQFTRAELEHFANVYNLKWREDASNQTLKYSRNRIRHKVVPELRKINPSLEVTFENTLRHLQSSAHALNYFCNQWLDQHLQHSDDKSRLDIKVLQKHPCADALLFQWLHTYGFTETQLLNAKAITQAGKVFESKTHRLQVEQNCYVLMPLVETQPPFEIKLEYSKSNAIQLPDGREFSWKSIEMDKIQGVPPNIARLDAAKIIWPLHVRSRITGDIMKPLGMNGKHKLISDILTDEKVAASEKDRVLVLESNAEIAWLIGFRISETFKLREQTTTVIEFEIA